MKNDLAFIVNLNLFLYEHQSTYNPNMPLRDLFYIASEYQKMVDHKSLYSSVLQMIPSPKFLVFYNGIEEIEDRHTECLSSAFENLIGEPDLELKVTTLNINEGHNQELMDQCKVLKEYVQYVAKVRSYVGKMGLDEAVACAVEECIQEGVLAEFLHKNRAEVEMVSIFEYNKEEEERKLRKAEYEGGYEAGKRRGLQDGEQLGIRKGIRKGIQETMLQMAKEFRLDDEAVIRLMCEKLEMDEKAAREMIHKE